MPQSPSLPAHIVRFDVFEANLATENSEIRGQSTQLPFGQGSQKVIE